MIKELYTWNELARGLLRYAITANICYEIHLEYYDVGRPIGAAKASLYLVSDWIQDGASYFSRVPLLEHSTVRECLEAAAKDNDKNNLVTKT